MNKNLLKNNITNKLKQNIPKKLYNQTKIINKLKKKNLKKYLQLSNLNKKFNSKIQIKKNHINNKNHQLIKHHKQIKKNNNTIKQNQKKIKIFFNNHKNSSSTLPQISNHTTTPITKHIIINHTNNKNTFIKKLNHPSTYPHIPINKNNSTYIKIYKQKKIFLPQNKYPNKHSITKPKTNILKKNQTPITPNYKNLTLNINNLNTYNNQSSSPIPSPKKTSKQKSTKQIT